MRSAVPRGRLWLISLLIAAAPPLLAQDRSADFEYALDLTAAGPLGTVLVPDDRKLDIHLANVVPAATYRVTQKSKVGPPYVMDVGPARFGNMLPSAACAVIHSHVDALKAAPDEAEVATRLKAMTDVLRTLPCEPVTRTAVEYMAQALRPSLRNPRLLSTGEDLAVTVERLAPGTGEVARRWQVMFRGRPADYGWVHPSEQAWIVASVAREMTAMAWQAARGQGEVPPVTVEAGTDIAPSRFAVSVALGKRTVSVPVTLAPHAWSPEAYQPLAQQLREALSVKRRSSPESGDGALGALTDLRAAVLDRESGRVSAALARQPLDASLHEQAALVLGAFALREGDGPFNDVRPILCKLAAHLAFARGPAGPVPSRHRRWSEIVLSTLVGRQREALDAMAARAPAPGPESAWATALSLRNGLDWRPVTGLPQRTLLERIAYFRAGTRAMHASQAWLAFKGSELESVPDWSRALLGVGRSIEEGHRFSTTALPLELQELGGVLHLDDPQQLIQALSGTAPGAAPVEAAAVLDRDLWLQAARRHVYGHLAARERFLDRALGLPEQAAAFSEQTDREFGALPLYPLVVRMRRADPKSASREADFCAPLRKLVQGAPERVTARIWEMANRDCRYTTGFPSASAWFRPPLPAGTTLDASARLLMVELQFDRPADIRRWRELAPFDVSLLDAALGAYTRQKPAEEAVVKELGPPGEYNVRALRAGLLVLRGNAEAHRRMAEKLCALSADECGVLAGALREAGMKDEAARAYQRAVDHGLDRVAVANQSQWLVTYYQERGDVDRALAVARQAEETHSAGGLAAMARLLERLGRYEEAERRYQQLGDRYESEKLALLRFHLRVARQRGGERYARQAGEARAKLFPKGLERVTVQQLGPGPVPGPVLSDPSEGLRQRGGRPGDMVVALDGFRVRDQDEYGNVKALSDEPTMRVIIWHQGSYLEVEEQRERINYFQRDR